MDFSANYNYSGKIYKATRKVVKLATPEMFPYNSSYKAYKFGTNLHTLLLTLMTQETFPSIHYKSCHYFKKHSCKFGKGGCYMAQNVL